MANLRTWPTENIEREIVEIDGVVTLTTGTPTVGSGVGYTVSKPNTGLVKVTFDKVYPGIRSFVAIALQGTTPTVLNLTAFTASTSETSVVIKVLQESASDLTATDITGSIWFIAKLKNTSV